MSGCKEYGWTAGLQIPDTMSHQHWKLTCCMIDQKYDAAELIGWQEFKGAGDRLANPSWL